MSLQTTKLLETAPVDIGVALIMRHSKRYPIPFGSQGIKVPLTPCGIQLAEQFGKYLDRPIERIASSPIGRCIETGEAIGKGAGIGCDVSIERYFGEPGAFVTDVVEAGPWFYFRDPIEMINRQLNGGHIPGTRSIDEGIHLILQVIFNPPTPAGKVSIFITHDSVLACIIYYLAGVKSIDEEMWPVELEGCCLWKQCSKIYWMWRNKKGYFVT